MQRDTVNILDVNIDRVSMNEAVNKVEKFLSSGKFNMVFTPNAEIVMAARKEPLLMTILNDADLVVPDGVGVVLASKINGTPVKEKVAGFELLKNLLIESDKKEYKIYFFGGKPGIADKAIHNVKKDYKNINFVGSRNGYFNDEDEQNIIDDINKSNVDFLFVALGAPRQEYWIYKNRDKIKAKVAIGVGGSFDILAGEAKRAPKIFIKLGLEWFYRLIKEPWRYKRMLELPKFAICVIRKKIFDK